MCCDRWWSRLQFVAKKSIFIGTYSSINRTIYQSSASLLRIHQVQRDELLKNSHVESSDLRWPCLNDKESTQILWFPKQPQTWFDFQTSSLGILSHMMSDLMSRRLQRHSLPESFSISISTQLLSTAHLFNLCFILSSKHMISSTHFPAGFSRNFGYNAPCIHFLCWFFLTALQPLQQYWILRSLELEYVDGEI